MKQKRLNAFTFFPTYLVLVAALVTLAIASCDNGGQGPYSGCRVIYHVGDGQGVPPFPVVVAPGNIIELPAQETMTHPEGKILSRWSDGVTTYPPYARYVVNSDVNFTAEWAVGIGSFTITYNRNNGTGTAPANPTVPAGTSVTLASGSGLSRSGYTFDGWNTNSSGSGITYPAGYNYTPVGDVTLYAKWDYIQTSPPANNPSVTTYTVSFNSNGGNGSVSSQSVTAGASITLPSGSGLSRSGYTFGGWNTNSSGTGTTYSAGSLYTPNASVTLYAKWDSTGSLDQYIYDSTQRLWFELINGNAYRVRYSPDASGSVVIPASYNGLPVTEIGRSAFFEGKITNVTIPSGVTTIGETAFGNCSNLRSVTIPGSISTIGEYAFGACTSLTSITIPSGVRSIGDQAFSNCKSLTSVTIPGSLTSFGSEVFSDCTSLTSVTISSGVRSIGEDAFMYCTNLRSVSIPSSVTSIGSGAFAGCSSLNNVSIPSSVTSIGSGAFAGCSSLNSITIPSGVRTIEIYTFHDCTGLTSVTISSGVTSIGPRVFYDCISLRSVNIPSSVTSIGEYAFSNCTSLTSITIPSSVTSIGIWAFSNWRSGQTINVQGHANQESADAAWGQSWRSYGPTINYQGQGSGGSGSNPFVGTWSGYDWEGDIMKVVMSDSTWTISYPDYPSYVTPIGNSGTYTRNGNNATLYNSYGYSVGNATVSGNNVTFSGQGVQLYLTRQ